MSGETPADKQKRLAQALRANLRKRKTQIRDRAAGQPDEDLDQNQDDNAGDDKSSNRSPENSG